MYVRVHVKIYIYWLYREVKHFFLCTQGQNRYEVHICFRPCTVQIFLGYFSKKFRNKQHEIITLPATQQCNNNISSGFTPNN